MLLQLKHVLLLIVLALNLRLAARLIVLGHHLCYLVLPHLTHELAPSRMTIRSVSLIHCLDAGYVVFLFSVVVFAYAQIFRLLGAQVSQILARCQLYEDRLSLLLWHVKLAMTCSLC